MTQLLLDSFQMVPDANVIQVPAQSNEPGSKPIMSRYFQTIQFAVKPGLDHKRTLLT
jgi:hypothetical protein